MADLNTTRNTPRADDVYQMLIDAHEGLSKAQSDAFNARLILTLMNHIGDAEVIADLLDMEQSRAGDIAEDRHQRSAVKAGWNR